MGLIEWMLERDVGNRCCIDDVLLHSWTNMYVDLDDYHWEDIIPTSSRVPLQASDKYLDDITSVQNLPSSSSGLKTTLNQKTNGDNDVGVGALLRQMKNINLNHSI